MSGVLETYKTHRTGRPTAAAVASSPATSRATAIARDELNFLARQVIRDLLEYHRDGDTQAAPTVGHSCDANRVGTGAPTLSFSRRRVPATKTPWSI